MERGVEELPRIAYKWIAMQKQRKKPEDMIQFARISKERRYAVIEALNFNLTLSNSDYNKIPQWFSVVGQYLLWLDLSKLDSEYALPKSVGAFPHLRRAIIQGCRGHFTAVSDSPRLFHLHVVIQRDTSWTQLFRVISNLRGLQDLELGCANGGMGNMKCMLNKLDTSERYCDELVVLGARLGGLHFRCNCCREGVYIASLLKSLKKLSIHTANSSDVDNVLRLKELRSLQIISPTAITIASRLGERLYSIRQPRRVSGSIICMLEGCSKLHEVRVGMLPYAEKKLWTGLRNAAKSGNLKVVELRWGYDEEKDGAVCDEDGLADGGESRYGAFEIEKHNASMTALIRVIEAAGRMDGGLQELVLRGAVWISWATVQVMLRKCGGGLEVLEIPSTGHREDGLGRLVKVLESVYWHCPRLKVLRFGTVVSEMSYEEGEIHLLGTSEDQWLSRWWLARLDMRGLLDTKGLRAAVEGAMVAIP